MKDEHGTVGLALDLRAARQTPVSAEDYEAFWRRNVGQLTHSELSLNQELELVDRHVGSFTLRVTQLPKSFQRATESTRFAIRSVLERPRVNFACRFCGSESDVLRHGPLSCNTCAAIERAGSSAGAPKQAEVSPRVCAAHAVI